MTGFYITMALIMLAGGIGFFVLYDSVDDRKVLITVILSCLLFFTFCVQKCTDERLLPPSTVADINYYKGKVEGLEDQLKNK